MAHRTRRIATRLALALVGAGFVTSGVVLLLRAVWVAVSLPLGPLWATVILGGALLLIGVVILVLAGRRSHPPEASDDDLIIRLTTAFMKGLSAGRSERDR